MGDQCEPAGAAVEAIQAAERALARQNSAAAQVDLQVVTAILNAHTARADGAGELVRVQSDVESALATRPDLDTPAGARSFQRYLLSRLHDIRSVVETAELDATSKASLSAALAALYANATPVEATGDSADLPLSSGPGSPASSDPPVDLGFGAPVCEPSDLAPTTAPNLPAATASPPSTPTWAGTPSGGGALPSLGSFGGLGSPDGLSSWGGLGSASDRLGSLDRIRDKPDRLRDGLPGDGNPGTQDLADSAQPDSAQPDAAQPDADIRSGVSPELAAVITAAVGGTPIPEAFAQQGIVIPPAGSPVTTPVDPALVVAGDVGILTDGYALSLGSGKALLDNTIQPLSDIDSGRLLGWLHPVKPESKTPVPVTAPPTA